jgi:pseudouridine-5'-phosphate glycosidase
LKVDHALVDENEAARIIKAKRDNKLSGGILIAVPIPREHALDRRIMDRSIEQALAEVKEKQINGYEVTPFLLRRVSELTGGASLASNIALILNNARVGARIAAALVKKP